VTGYGSLASTLLASQVEVRLPLTQGFVVRDRRKWIRTGWIHSGATEEGGVRVPEVLRLYMSGIDFIPFKKPLDRHGGPARSKPKRRSKPEKSSK